MLNCRTNLGATIPQTLNGDQFSIFILRQHDDGVRRLVHVFIIPLDTHVVHAYRHSNNIRYTALSGKRYGTVGVRCLTWNVPGLETV